MLTLPFLLQALIEPMMLLLNNFNLEATIRAVCPSLSVRFTFPGILQGEYSSKRKKCSGVT